MEVSLKNWGLPPVLIHFITAFFSLTIQLLGIPDYYQGTEACEQRIREHLPEQDALGHELQARHTRGHVAFEAWAQGGHHGKPRKAGGNTSKPQGKWGETCELT